MNVSPGAYRPLFIKALLVLLKQPNITEQEKFEANHYMELLANPEYVFGRPEIITMLKRENKDH